jgi:hypothetical protein
VTELAQALDLDEETVLEGLEARRAYAAVPLERPDGQAEVDGALVTVDSGLDEVVDRESLRPVLRGLPARDKRILALRYFRGLSQAQIAEELGISQMHVSRLLARTLGRLNECLVDGTDAVARDGAAGSGRSPSTGATAGTAGRARPPQPRRGGSQPDGGQQASRQQNSRQPAPRQQASRQQASRQQSAVPCRAGGRDVRRAG